VTEDDDKKRRRDLYDAHLKQTWGDIQSSTDNFDKNVLAVSTAALGFSIAFIKNVGGAGQSVVHWKMVLVISWICLAACIVITVFSFRLSVAALNNQLNYLYEYYENKNQEFLKKKSIAGIALNWFTWGAALFFFVGIICTMVFCIRNAG